MYLDVRANRRDQGRFRPARQRKWDNKQLGRSYCYEISWTGHTRSLAKGETTGRRKASHASITAFAVAYHPFLQRRRCLPDVLLDPHEQCGASPRSSSPIAHIKTAFRRDGQ